MFILKQNKIRNSNNINGNHDDDNVDDEKKNIDSTNIRAERTKITVAFATYVSHSAHL